MTDPDESARQHPHPTWPASPKFTHCTRAPTGGECVRALQIQGASHWHVHLRIAVVKVSHST